MEVQIQVCKTGSEKSYVADSVIQAKVFEYLKAADPATFTSKVPLKAYNIKK